VIGEKNDPKKPSPKNKSPQTVYSKFKNICHPKKYNDLQNHHLKKCHLQYQHASKNSCFFVDLSPIKTNRQFLTLTHLVGFSDSVPKHNVLSSGGGPLPRRAATPFKNLVK